MRDDRTFVIIGAGQAGAWAIYALRDEAEFEGKIVLIGDEEYIPYERPPLSKSAMLGDTSVEDAYFWPREKYDEWNVEMRLGVKAESIDRAAKSVTLSDGATIAYDRLLIATGTRPRLLPIEGKDLIGVHYLRTIADTLAIQNDIPDGGSALIIGGGWIGLEVAGALSKRNCKSTVVELADRLCGRAVPPEISDWLLSFHQGHGVDVRLDTGVERLIGENGKLAGAELPGGEIIDCTLAIIGIGVIPNIEIAEAAGLNIDNGVVVDAQGRTSDPDIFAAGDLTNHPNALLGRRIRLESWENAQNQARVAAKAMADKGEDYAEIPWFWSDQFDANIQMIGLPQSWEQLATRGDPASGEFITFYLKDGKIDGAISINNPRDVRFAKRLMQAGKQVSAEDLANPDIKLQALLKG
jgi:3-phenylpropionate/trans-cinnamate dioxygenase ferredoxin reductase component